MILDLSSLYSGDRQAKLAKLDEYVRRAVERVSAGAEVTLTGQAPVWLYLRIAHALHGVAKRLCYESPVTGNVEVFNHDPG